jgi:hypothetical protein
MAGCESLLLGAGFLGYMGASRLTTLLNCCIIYKLRKEISWDIEQKPKQKPQYVEFYVGASDG